MLGCATRQRLHRMRKAQLLNKIGRGQYVPRLKSDAGHIVTMSQSPESVTTVTDVTTIVAVTSTCAKYVHTDAGRTHYPNPDQRVCRTLIDSVARV